MNRWHLLASVYNFSGELLFSRAFDAQVEPNAALHLGSLDETDILQGASPDQVVVKLSTTDWDAPDNLFYQRDQKDLKLPTTTLSVNVDEAAQTVQITANGAHARMVKIDK